MINNSGEIYEDYLCIFLEGDIFTIDEDTEYDYDNVFSWINAGKTDKYLLMQFTGLKDRNGVEIYEGDILRYNSKYAGTLRGKIIFSEGRFTFINEGYIFLLYQVIARSVIIGNIYENPELLEPPAPPVEPAGQSVNPDTGEDPAAESEITPEAPPRYDPLHL
jgi:hypothetical protein